ncbi:MAG: amidase, partial [Armatimonadetes bacterium]|nr:amidase [Armatimonadota bacterium]
MARFTEYHLCDGLGLAELVRTKQVRPGELVDEAVGRIEELNPGLNAVIFKMYEQARELSAGGLADGPFTGVPFLLKDLGAPCAGVPMGNGSRFHR